MLLYEYLEDKKNNKFIYGEWDCLEFILQYYELIKVAHCSPDIRGSYSRKSEYFLKIKSIGFKNPEDYLNKEHKRIPLCMVKRGGVMLYNGALGLCDGMNSIFLNKPTGYSLVKTKDCKGAWELCHR